MITIQITFIKNKIKILTLMYFFKSCSIFYKFYFQSANSNKKINYDNCFNKQHHFTILFEQQLCLKVKEIEIGKKQRNKRERERDLQKDREGDRENRKRQIERK